MAPNDDQDAAKLTADAEPDEVRVCRVCRHYRMREEAVLFDSDDLQVPGVLKAHTEWQQKRTQRSQQEAQRFAAGQAFDYEPYSFAWCAFFTRHELAKVAEAGDAGALDELMKDGKAVVNPVSGEVSPVYALCARMNPEGRCEQHER